MRNLKKKSELIKNASKAKEVSELLIINDSNDVHDENLSKNIDTEVEENKDLKNECFIDPRKDISIYRLETHDYSKFRELNPLELKRKLRLEKEDIKIYESHPDLMQQETKIYSDDMRIKSYENDIPFLITPLMDHQLYGIAWMKNRELSTFKGGILADEMGLGKTLQILGLLLTDDDKSINLVILPAISLTQWINEMEKHAPGGFNIIVYHGINRKSGVNLLDGKNNIILTTYGTIESGYRKSSSKLHSLKFKRVILDEAHIIKDNRSSTSKAINALDCEKRWCITGTPLQNRVNDLLSLVRFLKMDPHSFYFCKKCPCKKISWNEKNDNNSYIGYCSCGHFSASHFSWWNRRISTPIKELGQTVESEKLFERLHQINSQIFLRRTKIGIEKSLGLPSKVVIVKRCFFSPQELEFYDGLYKETQGKYKAYEIQGRVKNNYMHIFELLQKMRMAVNHPYLAYKQMDFINDFPICGFCNEEADDPIKSKCNHIFCRNEAKVFLLESNKCPVCKVPITIDLNSTEEVKYKPVMTTESWNSSTKIEMLIEMLVKMRSDTNNPKSIIFSQFVNFLEILRWRLERAGIRCVKIYGSMNIGQRKVAIEEFNTNPEITVFLISLKAGGVALNLNEAENVFLMDLWWNPAVEEQAMDRIHRIGQHRAIRIYRMIIENSIESRIYQLQQKKKALFDSAVNNDLTALSQLTEDDLGFLFS